MSDIMVGPDSRFGGSIGLIGVGRLGSALAVALSAVGYEVSRLASRSSRRAEELASLLTDTRVAAPEAVVADCDLVFLAVPDTAVEPLAAALPWRVGQGAVHCSGALGLEVLERASAAGALAGCLHPLQSFPDAAPSEAAGAAARFRGISCGVEGESRLDSWLTTMVHDLGAQPVPLKGVDRALYHAAAVLVSNDAVALMAVASKVWTAAGLPLEAARPALAPLLLGAARNIGQHELHLALTGPVARGDVATVERHLRALEGQPTLAGLYRALARELLYLPLPLDEATRSGLIDALDS